MENLENLKNLTEKLKKSDETLIVADFDDTIFSTKEDKEKDMRKGKRADEGNEYIKNVIGIENYVKVLYKGKDFPKDIVSKMKAGKDLILTAGLKDLQIAKIKATNLEYLNLKVVKKAVEKPLALIDYIIKILKFIPKKIEIYEDRPNYFLEEKQNLEKILGSKIEIFLVKMNGNEEVEWEKVN